MAKYGTKLPLLLNFGVASYKTYLTTQVRGLPNRKSNISCVAAV